MANPETMEDEAEIHQAEIHEPETRHAPPLSGAPEKDPLYALPPAPRQEAPQARMPFLAGMFSLFPGLGNVYNGLYLRGVTFFLVCIGLIALATEARVEEKVLFIFSVIFVWFFNIFDAYRQATLINYGYTPGVERPAMPRVSAWGSGGLVAGVVIFALGLYGFLHQHFEIDLTLLADYWYVLFMAFGAVLIVRTVLERKKAEAAESDETFDGDPEDA